MAQEHPSRSSHGLEDLPRHPSPFSSLSPVDIHNDPCRPLETVWSGAELTSKEEYPYEKLKNHAGLGNDGDTGQLAIASGLRNMELAAHPSTPTIRRQHGLGLVPDNVAMSHLVPGHGDFDSGTYLEQGTSDTWRLSHLDVTLRNGLGGELAPLAGVSMERKLRWGTETQHMSAESTQWNDFSDSGLYIDDMHRGNETWTSTVGASSPTISRSLPDLCWASNSPLLNRVGTEWERDGLSCSQDGPQPSETRVRSSCATAMSILGALPGPLASATNTAGPQTWGSVSSKRSVAPEHQTSANRMEEGTIGSKKRIWYRAPNGQFASATETQYGHSTVGGAGIGEGSARSNDGIRRIRRRRKSEEVERKYRCDYEGCNKAYGTLNRECSSIGVVENHSRKGTAATHKMLDSKYVFEPC